MLALLLICIFIWQINDSLGVVKIQSDETKTKLVVDVLLVIVKLLILIIMAIESLPKDVISDEPIYATVILSHKIGDRNITSIARIKNVDTCDEALNAVVTVGKITGAIEIEILIRNRRRLIDPKTYTIHTICEESMVSTYELLKQNGIV